MKVCTKCEIEKDESEFYRQTARCKICDAEYHKKYHKKYRAIHPLLPWKIHALKCVNCGIIFKTQAPNAKYCCDPCRQEYYRKTYAEKRKPYYDSRKDLKKEYDKKYRAKNHAKKITNGRKYYQEVLKDRNKYRMENDEKYRNKIRLGARECYYRNKKYNSDYQINNYIFIENIRYNLQTCAEYIKPFVQALILLKNKNKLLKELRDD